MATTKKKTAPKKTTAKKATKPTKKSLANLKNRAKNGSYENVGRPAKWTEDKALQLCDRIIAWMQEKDKHIFYSYYITANEQISRRTLARLCKKYDSVEDKLDYIRSFQEAKLLRWGTVGQLNSNLTKFVLTNHHDYVEKSEITEALDRSRDYEEDFDDFDDTL